MILFVVPALPLHFYVSLIKIPSSSHNDPKKYLCIFLDSNISTILLIQFIIINSKTEASLKNNY